LTGRDHGKKPAGIMGRNRPGSEERNRIGGLRGSFARNENGGQGGGAWPPATEAEGFEPAWACAGRISSAKRRVSYLVTHGHKWVRKRELRLPRRLGCCAMHDHA
jgi:hypothetical protein